MDFKTVYDRWLKHQRNQSGAGRRRKLQGGLGFAEHNFLRSVWWPLIGNFNHLHAEYEVADYSGAGRFLDFAYLRGGVKLAIEIDGYTTHAQNIDRHQFAYRLHRQNVLILDRWDILRFAHGEVADHPRRCQRTIQQYIGSRFATDIHSPGLSPRITAIDREIVRLARSLNRPMSPGDVRQHLGVDRKTAYKYIQRLVDRDWLIPASGTERIRSYQLAETLGHNIV